MKRTDLRDLLPAERPLPAARRRDMKEQLMEQIETEERGGRRRYRLVVGAVAAALLIVTGVTAIALGRDDEKSDSTGITEEGQEDGAATTTLPSGARTVPRPDEVALMLQRYSEYGSGTPWLSGSEPTCVVPEDMTGTFVEGPGAPTMVGMDFMRFEAPFDRAVTAEDFIAACASPKIQDEHGDEATAAAGTFDPANATVCVQPGDYPSVLIALGGLTCDGIHTLDVDDARPMTDDDLAVINRMRAIDIAVLATPNSCDTRETAAAHLQQIIDEERLGLDITVPGDEEFTAENTPAGFPVVEDPNTLCFKGNINWFGYVGDRTPKASVFALPGDSMTQQSQP
jgi:hypothetical protein